MCQLLDVAKAFQVPRFRKWMHGNGANKIGSQLAGCGSYLCGGIGRWWLSSLRGLQRLMAVLCARGLHTCT